MSNNQAALSNNLVIGLPIRNEAARLPEFLTSLYENITKLKESGRNVTVIACINATTDHSEAILDEWNAQQTDPAYKIQIIKSAPGKFAAVREIAKYANNAALAFVDVDVVMNGDCLAQLSSHLEDNLSTHIAYANGVPVIPEDIQEAPFIKVQRDYYATRKALPPRNFLHGRVFMMRNSDLLLADLNLDNRLSEFIERADDKVLALNTARALKLEKGPLADDIYISYATLKLHGVGSIKQVESARAEYTPSLTKVDFWRYCRRTELEKIRLACLFPDFHEVEARSMSRDMSGRGIITPMDVAKSLERRAHLASAVAGLAKSNPAGLAALGEVWMATASTKAAFANAKNESASGARNHIVAPKIEITLLPEEAELPEGANVTAVLGLILQLDGKILSVVNKRGFDIPGGKIEPGEGEAEALSRELLEEASVTVMDTNRVGIFRSLNYPKSGDVSYMVAYAGKIDTMLPFSPTNPNEIVARQLMEPSTFLDCYTAGDQMQMAALVSRAQAHVNQNVFQIHPMLLRAGISNNNTIQAEMPMPVAASVCAI